MKRPNLVLIPALLATTLLALVVLTQSGCMLYANMVHAVGGDKRPAKYDGLEDTKLAIVTVTDSSRYSDDVSARWLSRKVGDILTEELKDVRLVREDQIQQWRDTNGWDSIDYVAIGKGVEAEKVLGIELTNMKLREGATHYRGHCDVTFFVIDVASGDVLYRDELEDFTYPMSAGQYTGETTEARFRKLYLGMLAKRLAQRFHPYDPSEMFALDGVIASQ